MKKNSMVLIGMTLIGLVGSPTAQAGGVLTSLKEYGLPCVVSMGLSAALIKNDGIQVGAAICAGVSTATFLNKKVVDDDRLRTVVEASVKEREIKIIELSSSEIKKVQKENDEKLNETRKILREVVAERLVQMESDIRNEIERKLSLGEFFPTLERRLTAKIKEEVILEGRARSRELVNQVVDEALRQLTSKKYGISDSSEN